MSVKNKNPWGDPPLKAGIPQWSKEECDEMLIELLGCDLKKARQMRTEWMKDGRSFRVMLIELALSLPEDSDDDPVLGFGSGNPRTRPHP